MSKRYLRPEKSQLTEMSQWSLAELAEAIHQLVDGFLEMDVDSSAVAKRQVLDSDERRVRTPLNVRRTQQYSHRLMGLISPILLVQLDAPAKSDTYLTPVFIE